MLCFRDMTFCTNHDCKKFSSCDRALTLEIEKKAREWWRGEDAPIAVYIGKPDCYEKENKENKDE